MANPAVILDAELRINQRGVTRQIQQVQRSVDRNRLSLNTRGISEPLGQISKSADEFDKSLAASNARVLAFGASVAIIAGVQRAFAALVTETIEVEKALADINVILNETERGLSGFSTELFAIAKNTGQSFRTAAAAATELARQGLGAEETLRRVNDALVLTRLSGIDATRAVEGLTAVVNGFARQAINTTEIINTLANVDAAFAVSTADLVDALARVGSTAQGAGVGFNELISIVTAAQQITARGGKVIGNSLKTIFTRLQRSSTLKALEDLGIATQNANGGFRDGISLLQDLANSYDTLQDSQRAYVSELVGGVFQINVLKALLGDLSREVSIYDGALDVANRTTDEAIRRNERLNQTIAASVNEVSNSISELLSNLGDIGADTPIRNVLGIVQSVADLFNEKLGEEAGSDLAKGFVKGFGAILGGPALVAAVTIATKLILTTAKFAQTALKQFLQVGNETQKIKTLQEGINLALKDAGTSYNTILAGAKGVEQAERKVLEILKQQNALRRGKIGAGINVGADLARLGLRLDKSTGIFKGANLPRKAEGSKELIPTIKREQQSIDQGVGGASRSAEPVVLPNFNFGKGKKGTVIANTDEVIVPNYGDTGADAIFNKTMMRHFGVPDGARKIGAKGIVPNFALPPVEIRPGEIRRADFLNWYHTLSDQDIFGLEFDKKDGTIRRGSFKRSFDVKSLVRRGSTNKKFYAKSIPFNSKRIPLLDFNKLQKNKKDPKFEGDNQRILSESFAQAYLSNVRSLSTGGKTLRIVDKARGHIPNLGVKNLFGMKFGKKKRPDLEKDPYQVGPFTAPGAVFRRELPPTSPNPNFGERIGFGGYADIFEGRGRLKNFVEKRFIDLEGRDKSRSIGQEFVMSKIAEVSGLPVSRVIGTLKRSRARGKIVKEKINGPTGKDMQDFINSTGVDGDDILKEVVKNLEAKFLSRGIIPKDLTYNNPVTRSISPRGDNFVIKGNRDELERFITNNRGVGGRENIIDHLTDRAVVVDTGIFETANKRFGSYARGFRPPFPTPKSVGKNQFIGFHGTNAPKFGEFDPSLSSQNASVFSSSKRIAKGFSQQATIHQTLADDLASKQPIFANPKDMRVEEALLTFKKPFNFRSNKDVKRVLKAAERDPKLQELFEIRSKMAMSDKVAYMTNRNKRIDSWVKTGDYGFAETTGVTGLLKRLGYDGYIAREMSTDVYGVFNPKTIKRLSSTPTPLAKGFIPSFANPALKEAINRELKATGLPKSQIRVESDASLASRFNPLGLGVTNTRDEPHGIGQGIQRAKMAGLDPKTHGLAFPSFARGDATIRDFNKLSETLKRGLAEALRIASPEKEGALQRSLSFAPREARVPNKKILEQTVIPRLLAASKQGGIGKGEVTGSFIGPLDAVKTELKKLTPEIKKIVPQRARSFSVSKTVGTEENAARVIRSLERKFQGNSSISGKNAQAGIPGIRDLKGKTDLDKLTNLIKRSRDPEQGLPPTHELTRAITKAVEAPQNIEALRRGESPRQARQISVAITDEALKKQVNEIREGPGRRLTKESLVSPHTRGEFAGKQPKPLRATLFAETGTRIVGSGKVLTSSAGTSFLDRQRKETVGRGPLTTPFEGPPFGRPPFGGSPFRLPGDKSPDPRRKPNLPLTLTDTGKPILTKQFLKRTSLEKNIGKNLNNLFDQNLKALNSVFEKNIPPTTIGGFPKTITPNFIDAQKRFEGKGFDFSSASRELRVENLRRGVSGLRFDDPKFSKFLTKASGAQTLKGDFIERVQKKVLTSGTALDKAMTDAAREIRKLNKIDPNRFKRVLESSVGELQEYERGVKQQRVDLEGSLREERRSRGERKILLGAESKTINKGQQKFLIERERERVLSQFGINKKELKGQSARVQRAVEERARIAAAENVLERTELKRQKEVVKSFGISSGKQDDLLKGRRRTGGFGNFIRSDKFTNAAFLGSFALSGASGFAGEGKLGKTLQTAGLGASFGLFGGGPGIVTGAGLGAAFGFIQGTISELGLNLDELDKAFQKINSTFTKNTEAVNQFIRTQSSLQEAILSGGSESQIRTLRDQLIEQFGSISDSDLRQKLLGAGGNVDRLFEIAEESRRRGERQVSRAAAGQLFGTVAQENSFLGVDRSDINLARERNPIRTWLADAFTTPGGPAIKGVSDLSSYFFGTEKFSPRSFLEIFDKNTRLSSEQITRLSQSIVDAGGLGEAGLEVDARLKPEAQKAQRERITKAEERLESVRLSLNTVDTEEGVRNLEQTLKLFGIEGEKARGVFKNTASQIEFLRGILDFSEQQREGILLARTSADAAVGTARLVKELQRLDRALLVEDRIANVVQKGKEDLNIQSRRGFLDVLAPTLNPKEARETKERIDFDQLINKQAQALRELRIDQEGKFKKLLTTPDKFQRSAIGDILERIRKGDEELIDIIKEVAKTQEKGVFDKETDDTRRLLEDMVVEMSKQSGSLVEGQKFQRLSLEVQKQIRAAAEAQNRLNTAIGGRDPLAIAKSVRQGEISINDLIKPFSQAAKLGVVRRRAERQFKIDPNEDTRQRRSTAIIDEAIAKFEQFKFLENVTGLPEGALQRQNEARRTVAGSIFAANARTQVSQLGGLSRPEREDINRAISSRDPEGIQRQIERFERISQQPGFSNRERDVAGEVAEVLTILQQSLETINDPNAFVDPMVKAIENLGGGKSLNDVVRAVSGSSKETVLPVIDALEKEIGERIKKLNETAIPDTKKAIRVKGSAIENREEQLRLLPRTREFNPEAIKVGKTNTGLRGSFPDQPRAKDLFVDPISGSGAIEEVLKGIRSGKFTNIGQITDRVLSESDKSTTFGDLKDLIRIEREKTPDQSTEEVATNFITRLLKEFDPNLLKPSTTAASEDQLKEEIGKLRSEVTPLKEELKKLEEAVRANTEKRPSAEEILETTPRTLPVPDPRIGQVTGRIEPQFFSSASGPNISIPNPSSQEARELEAHIADLKSSISDFSEAMKEKIQGEMSSILDLRMAISNEGVTSDELELFKTALTEVKEQIEEIRRNSNKKIIRPPSAANAVISI